MAPLIHRWGAAPPTGAWRPGGAALAGARLAGAGLLVSSGAIHLDLYLTSYGAIPTIGPLFLAQAVAAFALGAAAAASRSPWPSLAGALLALSTLGGYVVSLVAPLFGFREVRTTAGIAAAVVELAAAVCLGTCAARAAGLSRRLAGRTVGPVVAASALAASLALAFSSLVVPGGVAVRTVVLPRFGTVLASGSDESLYLLSSEAHGRIVCTGACLSIWPPLLVRNGGQPAAGRAVAGHLGVVRRRGGAEQVTDNGYPLYTYAGDGRPGAANGQAVVSFGGTWYLVRAAARSPAATPLR